MGTEELIYGLNHGDMYTSQHYNADGEPEGEKVEKTFWANQLKISAFAPEHARGVTITLTPFDENGNPLEEAVVATELSFDGCNRAIRAIRRHRDRVFGKAE